MIGFYYLPMIQYLSPGRDEPQPIREGTEGMPHLAFMPAHPRGESSIIGTSRPIRPGHLASIILSNNVAQPISIGAVFVVDWDLAGGVTSLNVVDKSFPGGIAPVVRARLQSGHWKNIPRTP